MSAASMPRYLHDRKLWLALLAGLALLAFAGLLGSGADLGSEIRLIAQDDHAITPFRWT
ncbi:MAG TPA: hypothetical protein VEX62_07345 [Candidatus Limnocylindrales bacterium]|nr:hypothetical protein [Candidatus Limnocylindrales bacterium]